MKFVNIVPAYFIQRLGKALRLTEVKRTTRLLIPFSLVIFICLAVSELSISKEVDYLKAMGVVRQKNILDAPNFILSDLEGNKWSLKNFKGKFLMLNFWATW